MLHTRNDGSDPSLILAAADRCPVGSAWDRWRGREEQVGKRDIEDVILDEIQVIGQLCAEQASPLFAWLLGYRNVVTTACSGTSLVVLIAAATRVLTCVRSIDMHVWPSGNARMVLLASAYARDNMRACHVWWY